MPGLQTQPRELTDKELEAMVLCASAVMVGATYMIYDMAIAEAMEHSIKFPEQMSTDEIRRLYTKRQLELPRIDAQVSHSWVVWASSTWDNWWWMLGRYRALQQTYFYRFGRVPKWYLEVRRLAMSSPRPRTQGRTPFPEEAC